MQKDALPSMQAHLFRAKRETKIPEITLRYARRLGVTCRLLYEVSPPRSSYAAPEELTCLFLDPAFSLPDTPTPECWTCCCGGTHRTVPAPDPAGGGSESQLYTAPNADQSRGTLAPWDVELGHPSLLQAY